MKSKFKRDQIPADQAKNWEKSLEEELTFNLKIPPLFMQKETYLKLAGENDNRVRIYLGIEPKKKEGKYVLCAYAVSAFLLGSGDVFRDYENPVFKLDKKNQDQSSLTDEVLQNIGRYREWRMGKLDAGDEGARFRKYIYPNSYLMSKYELQEILISQDKKEARIAFGISKTMNAMVYQKQNKENTLDMETEVFDFSAPCPPNCDESSIFNSSDNGGG